MSIEAPHPQVAEALRQLQQFSSTVEDQLQRKSNASFTATDEAKTVNVTLDGGRCLTGLYIEDGLLRLGAETVAQRINEALASAQAASSEALAAQQEQIVRSLVETTDALIKTIRET
jgi:DNA-binding protein YbaB